MAVTITQGQDRSFDIQLRNPNETAFDLTGSTSIVTLTTVAGTTLLTLTLIVDDAGITTTSDGLEVGSGGVTAGVITMTLTDVQTAALPTGRVFWNLNLTSQDDTNEPNAASGEYMVIAANARRDIEQNYGMSLAEIRRRLADEFGDYLAIEATSASDSSHLIDTFSISGASDTLSGRECVVVSGANVGHRARISSYNANTNTITITPAALTSFAVGDQVDVFNTRGRGWSIAEYDRAINAAIDDAFPLALVDFYEDVDDAFDWESPTIDIPASFLEVYDIAWLDPHSGVYVPIRRGAFYGWSAREGTITILDRPGQSAHDRMLRIFGYGRHPRLQSDSDSTTLHVKYIVARAAFRLIRATPDRETSRGNMVMLYKEDSERALTLIRTIKKKKSVRVRAGV